MYSQSFKHHIGDGRVAVLGIQIIAFLMIAGCSSISPEAQLKIGPQMFILTSRTETGSGYRAYFLPEFQKFCPIEQYTDKNVKGFKVLNHMLGIPEGGSLELNVVETRVYGNAGQVFIDISYQGKSLDLGQANSPREWVRVKGEWWSNPEDWEKECPKSI
ncbi:MAG: hypothetical protein CM1200mP15_18790 [Dehalococcoidia bacterium]|nr:MAG: hypothetical protein CM1200mP15_18790 [Dehalococcoidia bacterium]